FNGFWPKAYVLHHWIYNSWIKNCEIYLCSKVFFIIQFETEVELQKVLNDGPWFWGRAYDYMVSKI
ncbi:DUF4283 domain-containing protein, partial [Actinobacillus pleuropneumoniae]|uniref:DUF4283 domain-containing protein n=1 Tax=Actinobacillus pleuropneumoniae TaxID=715 RepID=UPI00227D2DCF